MKNTPSVKELLGANVRRFRQIAGLTQQELAEKVDVESGGYISKIENAKKWPRAEILAGIAKTLNIRIRDLFDDKSADPPSTKDKMLNNWVWKFRAQLFNKDEGDIEAIYEFIKKMSRKKKSSKK